MSLGLVLLGNPVEHSLSPTLHTVALASVGIRGQYTVRQVDAAGIHDAFGELRSGTLDGANVTMPHKTLAAELSDAYGEGARRTRAVNTLVRVGSDIVGHNTDIGGIRTASVRAQLPDDVPVVVLGAGGAGAAALVAFRDRDVSIAARRSEAAEELVERTGIGHVATWGPVAEGSIAVNATPIGMHNDSFPAGWLAGISGLFDMAYGSGRTTAVTAALNAGLPAVEGPDMLLAQAAESFWLWTGREAPIDEMRSAMVAEQHRRSQ